MNKHNLARLRRGTRIPRSQVHRTLLTITTKILQRKTLGPRVEIKGAEQTRTSKAPIKLMGLQALIPLTLACLTDSLPKKARAIPREALSSNAKVVEVEEDLRLLRQPHSLLQENRMPLPRRKKKPGAVDVIGVEVLALTSTASKLQI